MKSYRNTIKVRNSVNDEGRLVFRISSEIGPSTRNINTDYSDPIIFEISPKNFLNEMS